ncbi:hypothetical protein [Bradyrhizobium liaoningense]|uniref:hypothetical protein n=1 Tax=Bradyrhizobium liaoningense TaxID=43992 RepID=UPI001BA83070|nr:hypothetical protein [Bradyrhizobium liaoningense]MBR0947127.1 hypothetical protein [Bradyrhizobium liaoningense]
MQRQALDPVLKQISRRTDPYALETLARALQALPCKLTKGQARQALDAVLKQIGEMNTDWTLRTLAQALGALAGKLTKAQAVQASKAAAASLGWPPTMRKQPNGRGHL